MYRIVDDTDEDYFLRQNILLLNPPKKLFESSEEWGVVKMSFELYEHVMIKKNGVIGQIIDIAETKDGTVYIVESDVPGDRLDADYPSKWPLYDCKVHEITRCIGIPYEYEEYLKQKLQIE